MASGTRDGEPGDSLARSVADESIYVPALPPRAQRPRDYTAVSDSPKKREGVGRNRKAGAGVVHSSPDSTGEAGEPADARTLTGKPDAKLIRNAAAVLEEVFREFADLRKEGRNKAWTDLEDKVSRNASVLVASGLITAKDMVGMLIDIEQFRKADSGGGEMPGDQIASWLSEHVEEPVQ
jgi:hypothetical protein